MSSRRWRLSTIAENADLSRARAAVIWQRVEFEANDRGVPVAIALALILSRIPERTIVGWIKRHRAVVAPAVRIALRPRSRRRRDTAFHAKLPGGSLTRRSLRGSTD